MFSLLTTRIGRFLAAIAAAAVIILGAFKLGQRDQRKAQQVEQMENYVDTHKEMKDVEELDGPDDRLERLRKNGWII